MRHLGRRGLGSAWAALHDAEAKTYSLEGILTCLGLPAYAPPLAPAREREQVEFGFEG